MLACVKREKKKEKERENEERSSVYISSVALQRMASAGHRHSV